MNEFDDFDLPDYPDPELAERVEACKKTLVERATSPNGDDALYRRVRRELLGDPELDALMPSFMRSCRNLTEFWPFIQRKFGTYQERREWLAEQFRPLQDFLELGVRPRLPIPGELNIDDVSLPEIQGAWQRMHERRENDPEGAITSARSLIETVCKHILAGFGQPIPANADLPALYKLTARCLKLAPDDHNEEIVKQILSGCVTVVRGLSAFRNAYGDAHGKQPGAVRPAPRHAELAINAAGTLATFLMMTWEARATASPQS